MNRKERVEQVKREVTDAVAIAKQVAKACSVPVGAVLASEAAMDKIFAVVKRRHRRAYQ